MTKIRCRKLLEKQTSFNRKSILNDSTTHLNGRNGNRRHTFILNHLLETVRFKIKIMRNILLKVMHIQATTADKRRQSGRRLLVKDSKFSINSTDDEHEISECGGLCTSTDVQYTSGSQLNINNTNKSRDSQLLIQLEDNSEHVILFETLSVSSVFGRLSRSCFLRYLDSDQVFIAKFSSNCLQTIGSRSKIELRQKLQHEKKYWDKVSMHPNFYPLLGIVELGNRSCFLTDNIPCTSLKALIEENGSLQESDICQIAAQIVLAVEHLHQNGIVHRCLTPDVISLDWRGRVRIADLSTCKQRGCSFDVEAIQRIVYPFIAPEILRGQCYEPCSDWWNVGCCLYQLLTRKSLLTQHNSFYTLFQNISKECCKEAIEDIIRAPIEYPKELSPDAVSILSKFLEKDPSKRLKWNRDDGINSIKENQFFSSIDWEKLADNESLGTIQMDLSFCIWSREQAKVHQLLGNDYGGKYGKCHIINHVKTNEEGVMKVIWKAQMRKTHSGWRRVMNERLVWQKVSGHPYILSLKGFFETEATYCFVTHHIRDAVALNVVNKSAPLPEQVVKYLSGQLVIAINYLHHNGILHRSLSPECVLVEKCGRLRLCDFENAKIAESSCHPFGDCAYMAPEIIQGKEYGKEADWWSFAIILLEMLLGNTPLDIYCDKRQITEESDITTEVLLRASESIPKQLTSINSMSARKLLRDFLTTIPEHRLGFKRNACTDIKSHHFYKGLIWQKMESPEPIKEESEI